MSVSTSVRLEPINMPMRMGVHLPPERHEVSLPIDDDDGSFISAAQPLGINTVCTVRTNLSTGEPVGFQIAVTPEMTARDVFRVAAHEFEETTKEPLAPFDLEDIFVTNCRVIRIGVGLRR